jgi:integrase
MARTAKPWFYRQTGWWMVWLDGKKVKLAKGRKNKKQAEQRLLELRFEASRNPEPECPEQTVASVIDTYYGFARKRLAKSTLSVRTPYLQSFAEAHGWRRISDCRPHHVEQWVDDHQEWGSDWTRCSAVSSVHAAFNWAAKGRLIEANPFRGFSCRPGSPRRDITADEFQALLRASAGRRSRKRPSAGARFRQVLIFLSLTGCRPCEAASLRWENVDFEQELIILTEHKTSRTQRKAKPRIIPMHPVVVKLLKSIKKRREGEHVFLTYRLTPWNRFSLGLRVRRAREKAGIPDDAKLYGVRHAFGTRGVVNGCDIKTLAELMGHTTTRMTEHYLHLAGQREHLASAMLLVNGRRRDA